jgi:hypothetical protein
MHRPNARIANSSINISHTRRNVRFALSLPFFVFLFAAALGAQERTNSFLPAPATQSAEPPPPSTQNQQQSPPPQNPSPAGNTQPADGNSVNQNSPPTNQEAQRKKQQPKRILGVMPNFRAVSPGTRPPPPTAKQSFVIATQNSFDYSAFIFVGITSLLAEGTNAHSQLGKGVAGYGRYYWRGFVDKTDGNYLVIFALPTVFHQDERYYAMGQGGFWKRAFYSASRIAITPDYHGNNSFNISELLGRGIAQGVSVAYYPSQSRTVGAVATKYAFAIGRDALTNVFREFWPDIAQHLRHRH